MEVGFVCHDSGNVELGLLIDEQYCNSGGRIYFVVYPSGSSNFAQWVVADSYWRYLTNWVTVSQLAAGWNTLRAEYDFGANDLWINAYVNDEWAGVVRVLDYNGSGRCKAGVYVGGPVDADFDDFAIVSGNVWNPYDY